MGKDFEELAFAIGKWLPFLKPKHLFTYLRLITPTQFIIENIKVFNRFD